mmetsp:Transcript_14865/g.21804  ORF Transcript_14865/g.21804 Transcript_14865/m.21804 type:complete len:86 (+) Transcript_14865:2312-2569(+)
MGCPGLNIVDAWRTVLLVVLALTPHEMAGAVSGAHFAALVVDPGLSNLGLVVATLRPTAIVSIVKNWWEEKDAAPVQRGNEIHEE